MKPLVERAKERLDAKRKAEDAMRDDLTKRVQLASDLHTNILSYIETTGLMSVPDVSRNESIIRIFSGNGGELTVEILSGADMQFDTRDSSKPTLSKRQSEDEMLDAILDFIARLRSGN